MKYITVKLTEDQAYYAANIVELDISTGDWKTSSPEYTFAMRIVNKLRKELAHAKS